MTINALTTRAHLEEFLAGTQGYIGDSGFDVVKDPRTGQILAIPARSLAIQETADEPRDALFKVRHEGS